MRDNWLSHRLATVKQDAPLWTGLADAIQAIFTQQVDPLVNRIRGMTSSFTMVKEDMERRVQELGSFFYLSERVPAEDWPLALMQRQDEIHLKGTDYPLINTISREFSGIKVTWEPLWAPIDQQAHPYGSTFLTASQLADDGANMDDWFLTARGVIRVALTELPELFSEYATIDDQATQFESILSRFIKPLIPLHIVFDGAQYYLHYTLPELEELIKWGVTEAAHVFLPVKEAREVATQKADITQTMPAMNNGTDSRTNARLRMDANRMDSWTIDRPLPGAAE